MKISIFLLIVLLLVVGFMAWDLGYLNKAVDVINNEIQSRLPIPIEGINIPEPPNSSDWLQNVPTIPSTPGPAQAKAIQDGLSRLVVETVMADGGTHYPTLAPPEGTSTPGPSPTPQPVSILLKGDIAATRNFLARFDQSFTVEIVEAGFWYGVLVLGEGGSGPINYQSIKTGWFYLDELTQRLGQWAFDRIVPNQEIRTGVEGSAAVIAGYRFEDLIPIEVTPLEEDANGNPLWVEVPCAQGQPQNAVCQKQPVRVRIKARVCYGLEHVGPNTEFFVADSANRTALLWGELISNEPAAFRTANGFNVAWDDFYSQITHKDHLELAGYRAVENLTEGALHEGLETLLAYGGWSEVDLQVEIANDWRANPVYCLDNSPVH